MWSIDGCTALRANTRASSSELLASLFAPCSPVHATSPAQLSQLGYRTQVARLQKLALVSSARCQVYMFSCSLMQKLRIHFRKMGSSLKCSTSQKNNVPYSQGQQLTHLSSISHFPENVRSFSRKWSSSPLLSLLASVKSFCPGSLLCFNNFQAICLYVNQKQEKGSVLSRKLHPAIIFASLNNRMEPNY